MENKYHTPEIEELYIGFELEHKNPMQENRWKKEIVDSDMWGIAYSTYEEEPQDYPNEIRVKYLDKEDIESLGFKDENILHPTVRIYNSEYKNQNGDNINLLYVERSNWCLIFAGEFGVTTWWDENNEFKTSGNIFAGYIKNKSELKKLLKQLNIKHNDKN